MRDAVRRLRQLRLPAMAGRRGLPVALAALAVVAAASAGSANRPSAVDAAPAGTTVLPPAAPPTYSYPGTSGSLPGVPTPPSNSGGSTVGSAGGSPSGNAAPELAANGIPARALQAYKAAATASHCGLPWSVLAAIGRVESDHGRFGGATLLADGRSDPPIVGIPLDGRPGVATIRDTDQGRYDGDTTYDRAVGPMQFIPGTWALFAADGNHDGKSDPFSIDDAAAAAAGYLCRAGGDLSTLAGQRDAVYSYNRSDSYVQLVLDLAAEYAGGAPVDNSPAPNRTPGPLPPISTPRLPPATSGPPPAASPPPTTTPPTTTTPRPTTPAPTTTRPAPTTTAPTPTTPAPTTTTPAPTTPTPTPSPTCTPAPTPTPTPSGSATGNATSASAAGTTAAAAATPTSTESASAAATPTGTPTPTPTPTLPTCPTP